MSVTPLNLPEERKGLDPVPAGTYPFRPVALGLLSAVIPGSGHLLLSQRRKGIVLLILFMGLLSAFWPLRLLRYYAGFLGLFGSWIVLGVYASGSAFLASRMLITHGGKKWRVIVLAPLSFAILSLTGAVLTRLTGFRSFLIPSTGMEPTIRQGDHIVADMSYYRSRVPNRLEIILFKRDGIFYVKRVIAVAGDSIEGRKQEIYVNGKELTEPYVEHIGEAPEWANTFGPVSVPASHFFVMGDNRDYSLDSRSEEYGFVDQGAVAGKPLYIFETDRTGKSIH